ncbi:GA module-containing protein, partial [Staphylococcus warneri]|uniref:GA module-containing protein n=1 Tax=Staphylococcus warneri TaxID=1292 RepID=UPI0011A61103
QPYHNPVSQPQPITNPTTPTNPTQSHLQTPIPKVNDPKQHLNPNPKLQQPKPPPKQPLNTYPNLNHPQLNTPTQHINHPQTLQPLTKPQQLPNTLNNTIPQLQQPIPHH